MESERDSSEPKGKATEGIPAASDPRGCERLECASLWTTVSRESTTCKGSEGETARAAAQVGGSRREEGPEYMKCCGP